MFKFSIMVSSRILLFSHAYLLLLRRLLLSTERPCPMSGSDRKAPISGSMFHPVNVVHMRGTIKGVHRSLP